MLPFTKHGTGDTILLFLHFFGSSGREWHHVIQHLAPHYTCIAADLPGFGEAAHIPGYTVDAMRAQVDELILHLAPAPVILIGHSMGGKVSMVVAATPPANLQQLILVAPSPLQPEPMTNEARETMTLANTTPDRIETFVRGGAYTPLTDEDFALAVEDVQRASPAAWLAWTQSGTREDWSTRIPNLPIRTDLIVGEHDQAISLTFQIEHTLPLIQRTGGNLHIILNAAHMLPYEAATELTHQIQHVLEQTRTATL